MPFILIALALFTAGCIAYVAWALSSDKPEAETESKTDSDNGSKT